MYQLRLLKLLVLPSLLSGVLVMMIAALFLGATVWSYVAHSSVLYTYFFGPQGLVTILQHSPSSIKGTLHTLLAGAPAYDAVILIGAAVLGVVVYIALQIFDHAVAGTAETWLNLQTVNQNPRYTARHELRKRIVARTGALLAWLIYCLVFTKLVLPFCVLTTNHGVHHVQTMRGIAECLLGYVALSVGLHLHVVFLRLLMLRPRLFGGDAAIALAMDDAHSK
jgi:hypothetical protein